MSILMGLKFIHINYAKNEEITFYIYNMSTFLL